MDEIAAKKVGRTAAFAVRASANARGQGAARQAAGHVLTAVCELEGIATVAGYLAIGSELDPLPVMLALHGLGCRICVPEIEGKGLPLRFRAWTPGCATAIGAFGVRVPLSDEHLEPDLLIVPLLAFDRQGFRLGYGGGFYDRTLAKARAERSVQALGLAFSAQEVAAVPRTERDQPLDAIVTEAGVIMPA